jgi:RNAse (barnase) inhibitor barstar
MPKRIFCKGKGFTLVNSREEPANRALLGLLYDWRVVSKNKHLEIPVNDYHFAHQLPVALTRFLRTSKDTLATQIRKCKYEFKKIQNDRAAIKDEILEKKHSTYWLKEAESRIASVQRTLTDAEHLVVKFADKPEDIGAEDIDGNWTDRNFNYRIRVIKVSRSWWRDIYKNNLHYVQDKNPAYPLNILPVDEKPRKDGTKLFHTKWYEEREKGGPKVFIGYIATRSHPATKKPFIAISEKKSGALMKLTSRIKRWEAVQEARKTAIETPEIVYEIDETIYKTETDLHQHLAKLMQFPDYFTQDYDSLSEMLKDIVAPIKIKWTARLFSPWLFVDCFRNAMDENKQIKFEIVKYKECESEEVKLEDLV